MFGEPAGNNPSSPGKGHGTAPRPQHRCPIPIPLPPCRYGEGIGARGGSSGCPTAPHSTPRHPTAPQEEQLAAPWGCGAAVKVQLRFFARGAMATFPTWFNYGRLLPLQGGGCLFPAPQSQDGSAQEPAGCSWGWFALAELPPSQYPTRGHSPHTWARRPAGHGASRAPR